MKMQKLLTPFVSFVFFAAVLGNVHLSKGLMADGKSLPAGNYQVRLADAPAPNPVVGQGPDSEKWVEFVQGGKVVGREVASVISDTDMATIAKGKRPPTNGTLVEPLEGGEYVRVWINKDKVNYLVHLGTGK
jgi:hypothetical protein